MRSSWRRRPTVAGLVLLAGLIFAPRAAADATIDDLIRRLGDDDFDERQRATAVLAALGDEALPALHEAAATSRDAEIRWAARRLIEEPLNRCPGALAFAREAMKIAEVLRDESVCAPSPADVVEFTVRALYLSDEDLMPRDVARGLARVHSMKDWELEHLLWSAAAFWEGRGPFDPEADLDHVMARVVKQVDPYASWRDICSFQLGGQGNTVGIGLKMRLDPATRKVTVVAPIKSGPAYAAGVRSDDVLTRMTTYQDKSGARLATPDVVDVNGMDVDDVNAMLLGHSGSPVGVTVRREGVDHPLEFVVKRAWVDPETVLGFRRTKDDDWSYWLEADNKIAYVRLSGFEENTAADLVRALDALDGQGVQGLVLDLRFNPGGRSYAALEVTEQFLDRGCIVTLRPRGRPPHTFDAQPRGRLRNYPLVCLVNRETASAAEVVAACLQDHGRAEIAGERSAGRGSVQNIRRAGNGRSLGITTALFCRPSGKKIDRIAVPGFADDEWGVSPDAALGVELSGAERDDLRAELERRTAILPRERGLADLAFEDRQLERALRTLREEVAD
jgi:carboxyl-terminal processing protease